MLKALPNNESFDNSNNAKCGEIFCQSSQSFTIICTFCDMKTFKFDEFLLHFKNVHFEVDLWKTDEVNVKCTSYLGVNIKNELENVGHEQQQKNESIDEEEEEEEENAIIPTKDIFENVETFVGDFDSTMYVAENDVGNVNEWNDDNSNEFVDSDQDCKPKKKKRAKKQTINEFQCEHCNKLYKTATILKHHKRKYHGTEAAHKTNNQGQQCVQCAELLPNLRELDTHMMDKHGGFQCTQCERKYKSNYELKRHIITHSGIKNVQCDYENCQKRFFTKRLMRIHRRIHTDVKNYICEMCGYSCRNNEMLKLHSRTHTGEKPYACKVCDKRFASSSLLREHQPIHSTERPHVCDVCGAAFSRPKALYHHKHLHLGVKKFKCKLCGNAYAQAAGLAGHMRQHKADKFIV